MFILKCHHPEEEEIKQESSHLLSQKLMLSVLNFGIICTDIILEHSTSTDRFVITVIKIS